MNIYLKVTQGKIKHLKNSTIYLKFNTHKAISPTFMGSYPGRSL
jgi:hypothetical protein